MREAAKANEGREEVNKNIFGSAQRVTPADLVKNNAGGNAFAMSAEAQLAQYVVTGTFRNTFYVDAKDDVTRVIDLATQARPEFVAKLAVYGRERAYMKDAPAVLLAVLSVTSPALFSHVFARVVDNAKMLRGFVQVMRSGAAGRKSLGSGPKARVAQWIEAASVRQLVNGSVGNDPSLSDVIKLSRPKGADAQREALYGYLIGKPVDASLLPAEVVALEAFKASPATLPVPDVDFRLVDQYLSQAQWKDVARTAGWQMTRMNLNTFGRHGVFDDIELVNLVAKRLSDADAVSRARVFPYQLLAAYRHASDRTPRVILEAIHEALDLALQNVPAFEGRVAVFPDVSGSMRDPVTGKGSEHESKVRCVDVAALVSAAVLAKNRDAIVLPFEGEVVDKVKLSSRDSVLTNAERLAAVGGGSTAVSAPLRRLLETGEKVDAVLYVSDYESWADRDGAYRATGTATQTAWQRYKRISPKAKLVAIDVTPNTSLQLRNSAEVLHVGGFSDAVFDVIAAFLRGEAAGESLVAAVEAVTL